jgi:serine protease inhibitor
MAGEFNGWFRFCAATFAAGALLMTTPTAAKAGPASEAPSAQLARADTQFALDLYADLKARPGNLFFSPYSILTCLALCYSGASGNTHKQMAEVLHLPPNQQTLNAAVGPLQQALDRAQVQDGVRLRIANALWAQDGHPFLPAFLALARTQYQANLNQADFKTSPASAIHAINRWISERTEGKIPAMLGPGSLNEATRLVIANAIYFKAAWMRPFPKTETKSQPFFVSGGRQAQVQMMHHMDTIPYTENRQFQAVELPYTGDALAMLILLPKRGQSLEELESDLTPAFLANCLKAMNTRKVNLFLPRFKLDMALELAPELAKMGMPDAFSRKADFSGIDGARNLFVSAVSHKARVEVGEEGTEAAAATTAHFSMLAVPAHRPPPPPVFRADHPFLFFIREKSAGVLLFVGRLAALHEG